MGINNSKIAEIMGFSKGHVGWVRSGKATLTDKFARMFCSAFNISEYWLLTGKGEMYDNTTTVAETSEPYRVARFIRPLTPEQEEVLKLLEEDPAAKEMFETYIRLPKSKKRMHLARMLEDLEELQEKNNEGQGGARP